MDVIETISEKESFVFSNEVSFCLKYLKSLISLVSGNCALILVRDSLASHIFRKRRKGLVPYGKRFCSSCRIFAVAEVTSCI